MEDASCMEDYLDNVPINKRKKCCVRGCSDKLSKRHRFPKNEPDIFQAWIERIKPPGYDELSVQEICNKYVVCGKHFSQECQVVGTRRGLKRTAVPSINIPAFDADSSLAVDDEQIPSPSNVLVASPHLSSSPKAINSKKVVIGQHPEQAQEYIRAIKRDINGTAETEISSEEFEEFSQDDSSAHEDQNYHEDMNESCQLLLVWSGKGKPTDADHEATLQLLKLREEKNSLFSEKKTSKNKLWTQIAEMMKLQGYNVDSTKCRQKFANLQKGYIKFIDNLKTTGGKKKDPPPYYVELHEILGSKDKSNPIGLQDSFATQEKSKISHKMKKTPETDMEVDCGNNNNEYEEDPLVVSEIENSDENTKNEPTTSKMNDSDNNPKNRFKDSSRRIDKPKSLGFTVLQEIQKQYREEKEEKKRHYTKLEALLEKQNQQRDRMLDIFEKIMEREEKSRNE